MSHKSTTTSCAKMKWEGWFFFQHDDLCLCVLKISKLNVRSHLGHNMSVLLEKYIVCFRCFKWHTWVPKCSILSLVMLDSKDMSSHIWDTLYFICNGQTGSNQEWMPQIHWGGHLVPNSALYNRDSSPEKQQHRSFVKKCKYLCLYFPEKWPLEVV